MIQREDWQGLLFLLRRFIAPHWKLSLLMMLLSLGGALLLSAQPLAIAPAMDAILGTGAPPAASLAELNLNNLGQTMLRWFQIEQAAPLQLILLSVGLYLGVALGVALFQFGSYLLSIWVMAAARHSLQVALYEHILSFSLAYFVRQRTGDIVSRFTSDAVEAVRVLETGVRQLLQSAVQILVYALLLFSTNWLLASATLLVSTLHLGITRLLRDSLRNRTADQFSMLGEVSTRAQESVMSMRIIKSFAAEQFEIRQLAAAAQRLRHMTLRYGIYKHIERPLRIITDAVAISTVLLMAFWIFSQGTISTQGFILFVVLARQTIAPAAQFGQALLKMQEGLGAARRLLEIFHQQPDLLDGPDEAPPFRAAMTLEHVSFAYETGRPVLHDIALQIRKGEVVALVGPSGAGKSTLADLVLRLYDPTGGRVLYDGVDVRTFQQASYRQMFGVVSQESLLFNATVRENIAYGRPIDDEQVQRAAHIANADEFITRLPDGYATLVGDRGIRLSGGQRQRIAIARAIYAQPAVLVLDEATSSLDTQAEYQVQQAIDRVLEHTTALVIAHRLSTIVNADKIVVLNQGQIEAVAPHAELLHSSPTYRRLYTLQTGGTLDEPAAAAVAAEVAANSDPADSPVSVQAGYQNGF